MIDDNGHGVSKGGGGGYDLPVNLWGSKMMLICIHYIYFYFIVPYLNYC